MKKTRKWLAMLLAVTMILGSFSLTACGGSGGTSGSSAASESAESTEGEKLSGELNLYTWEAMFPQELLDGFTKETGVKINYSNFDLNEDMLAKLEETKGGSYDVIIADDYILEMVKDEGLMQKLNKDKISNIGNIDPLYQGYFYDPEDEYTVPIGAGVPLIVYDKALTGFELTGYADLWDERLKDNVAITANYRVIDGITLKTMGESFNTNDLATIEKAGEKLKELAPNIRLIVDDNTQDYVVSGEVAAAFLYTSQVTSAILAREDLSICYPKEGLGFGIMGMFIPSQAPNAAAANAFINYLLDAKNGAQWIEYLGYYSTNKAANEFISEEMKPLLTLPEGTEKGEIIQNVSNEAEDMHSKIWREFQEACE